MRFVVLAILLAFPAADLYVTARLARWTGVPLWIWLAGSFLLGLLLLRNERIEFRARMVTALHGDQSILRGVLDSGRKVLAGVLLIVPGVISDLIALVLLLLPINVGNPFVPQPVPAARGSMRRRSIDGDYRRLD